MGGAPRLLSFRVEGEALRNLVEFLGHEHELEGLAVNAGDVAVFFTHVLFELLPECFPYDIYDLAESGFHRVVDGVVDYGLAARAEAVHLFESAVTAAHAGSEYKKCRFHGLLLCVPRLRNFIINCSMSQN